MAGGQGISLSERQPARGEIHIEVIHVESGTRETIDIENLVVDGGKRNLARLFAGEPGLHATHVGFGSSSIPAEPGDAALTDSVVVLITAVSFPEPTTVRFDFELGQTIGNGLNIKEFGLLCADGTLFARRTRPEGLAKTSQDIIRGYWQIHF